MSEYSSLKAIINASIKANNNQEITGPVMNSVLNAMVNTLGAGYQFMGVATPTNPGSAQTPDYKCFYLATTPGTYTYLGGLVVADGEVAILKYDSSWTKEVTGVASADKLSQLGQEVEDKIKNSVKQTDSFNTFAISDGDGNNIVEFNDGHIKTKEFDSSIDADPEHRGLMSANDKSKLDSVKENADVSPVEVKDSISDCTISDENGNNIVELSGGHIKTKKFDSRNLQIGESTADFGVSDEEGNSIFDIENGVPKTSKFDGDYFKFDKCITIKAIADAGVSQLFGEGEYGFNSATMELFTKVGGVLTDVSYLLNRDNVFKLPAYEDTLYTWNGYNFTSISRSYLREIPKIPYMVFNIDTNLRDISDMYARINYGNVNTMLEQVYALFDELVAQHSDYITKVDAATEVGLTYPAYCNLNGQASGDYLATPTYRTYIYKLCDNDVHLGNANAWNHKRKIFITGGLHGNEYISPFNIYMLAKSLCDDFLESESFFKLRGTFDFYFIPCLNGYGQYHNTRGNANKVNINRNFPTPDWAIAGEDTKDSDQGNNFTGYAAGSEFETQIVIKQLEKIKPDIYIDHHNYGDESHYNYCTILTTKWYPLAGMSEVYAAYTLKKAYPQWFGNNFKGLLYGPAASPRVYYFEGKNLYASSYAGWKYQDMMALTIETAPHIRVVNGVWTGEPQVPDYSKDVLTMDEYLLRMQIEICANAYLFLNS